MKNNFYHKKKVFVTGHTGFKGAWLSVWLMKLSAQVCEYSITTNTIPSLFDVLSIDICN